MIIAKVLGPVVSTAKIDSLKARPIFVVQPLDKNRNAVGESGLALDTVSAGPGDIVLLCKEGNGCRDILQNSKAAINSVIAGIIDKIDL